jgi:hypothetical protein
MGHFIYDDIGLDGIEGLLEPRREQDEPHPGTRPALALEQGRPATDADGGVSIKCGAGVIRPPSFTSGVDGEYSFHIVFSIFQ